jgi:hypothetical protein
VLLGGGTVKCWGDDWWDQLGDGTTSSGTERPATGRARSRFSASSPSRLPNGLHRRSPAKLGGDARHIRRVAKVKAIDAGDWIACALLGDG